MSAQPVNTISNNQTVSGAAQTSITICKKVIVKKSALFKTDRQHFYFLLFRMLSLYHF